MDELALLRVVAEQRVALLDAVAWLLSQTGPAGTIWIAAALAGWAARRMKPAAVWQVVLGIGLASAVSDVAIKPVVDRTRPFEVDAAVRPIGVRPETASFPSGHAAVAGAAAVVLGRAWPTASAAWWSLAVMVAASRVYLGVHYPTDVIAGLLVGGCCGWLVAGRTSWYSLNAFSRASRVAR